MDGGGRHAVSLCVKMITNNSLWLGSAGTRVLAISISMHYSCLCFALRKAPGITQIALKFNIQINEAPAPTYRHWLPKLKKKNFSSFHLNTLSKTRTATFWLHTNPSLFQVLFSSLTLHTVHTPLTLLLLQTTLYNFSILHLSLSLPTTCLAELFPPDPPSPVFRDLETIDCSSKWQQETQQGTERKKLCRSMFSQNLVK